jgi:formamidopyrimidine-DNA glycosylase
MPELPEVETVVRGLRPHLEGRSLARVTVRRRDLRTAFPRDLATRLTGRRIEWLARRAKYILVALDDGNVLVVHLGMSGRMLVASPAAAAAPHDHVEFETDQGVRIVYNDPRRFGLMTLVDQRRLERHRLFRGLGPEPLGNVFNAVALSAALRHKRTPIKSALLDQRVVAGLGNIYVCEALFRAGISPRRLAASVAGVRAERLVPAIRAVLEEAIAAGGSSLKDYRQSTGELGYFQHRFAVYDRAGSPCPGCTCKVAVRRIVQAGRSTFYCAHRQR